VHGVHTTYDESYCLILLVRPEKWWIYSDMSLKPDNFSSSEEPYLHWYNWFDQGIIQRRYPKDRSLNNWGFWEIRRIIKVTRYWWSRARQENHI
jgi:hypothetical protein